MCQTGNTGSPALIYHTWQVLLHSVTYACVTRTSEHSAGMPLNLSEVSPCCCFCCYTHRQTLNIPFISFMDAAIVFTDTEIDPEGPAIVVLFR